MYRTRRYIKSNMVPYSYNAKFIISMLYVATPKANLTYLTRWESSDIWCLCAQETGIKVLRINTYERQSLWEICEETGVCDPLCWGGEGLTVERLFLRSKVVMKCFLWMGTKLCFLFMRALKTWLQKDCPLRRHIRLTDLLCNLWKSHIFDREQGNPNHSSGGKQCMPKYGMRNGGRLMTDHGNNIPFRMHILDTEETATYKGLSLTFIFL